MKNPKISVIVPIYNSEKYLNKCIDSIINQSYKNLELILINDGSSDSSGKILDEYASKDNRIIVKHKTNGGIGSAYNTAIGLVSGDYISFVDSDDYISHEMYKELIEIAKRENTDIVQFGIQYLDLSYRPVSSLSFGNKLLEGNELILKEFLTQLNKGIERPNLSIRFFRKKLFDGYSFLNQSQGIDEITSLSMILKSEKIKYIDRIYYHCVQRLDSVGRKPVDIPKLHEQMKVYVRLMELLQDTKNAYTCYAGIRYLKYILMNYPKIRETQEIETISSLNYLYDEYKRVYNSVRYTSAFKDEKSLIKLALTLFSVYPNLISYMYKAKHRFR